MSGFENPFSEGYSRKKAVKPNLKIENKYAIVKTLSARFGANTLY